MKNSRRILAVALLLFGQGCATVGPRAIRQGQIRYNQAIIDTRAEQLLTNLVRLRYLDPPYFLDVSSVSTQYVLGVGVDAGVGNIGDGGTSGSLGGAVGYEERPTVTYMPLQGEQFVNRLLSPVEMETILLLSISGWRVDRLFRCCVQRVNDLWNAPSASGPTPELAPDFEPFLEMSELIERLTKRNAVNLRFRTVDLDGDDKLEKGEIELRLIFVENAGNAAELRRLKTMLSIDPDIDEFRLSSNPTIREDDQIAIFPRSVMSAMSYLSQAVEPPQRDIDAGRVKVTRRADGSDFQWSDLASGLFRVRSSLDTPENAFVRVRYRDAWFYIDDSDLTSKATFNLLDQLFQLKAGNAGGQAPLLTLPVGG